MCVNSFEMAWEPMQTVGIPRKLGAYMTSRETMYLNASHASLKKGENKYQW